MLSAKLFNYLRLFPLYAAKTLEKFQDVSSRKVRRHSSLHRSNSVWYRRSNKTLIRWANENSAANIWCHQTKYHLETIKHSSVKIHAKNPFCTVVIWKRWLFDRKKINGSLSIGHYEWTVLTIHSKITHNCCCTVLLTWYSIFPPEYKPLQWMDMMRNKSAKEELK